MADVTDDKITEIVNARMSGGKAGAPKESWEGGGGFKYAVLDAKTIEVAHPDGRKVKVVKDGQNGQYWDSIMAERRDMGRRLPTTMVGGPSLDEDGGDVTPYQPPQERGRLPTALVGGPSLEEDGGDVTTYHPPTNEQAREPAHKNTWEGGGGFKYALVSGDTVEVTHPDGRKVKVVKNGQNGQYWDGIMAERKDTRPLPTSMVGGPNRT